MNRDKLILVGGGGHCKACIDVVEQQGRYVIHGILDRQELVGTRLLNTQIIGTDDLIPSLAQQGYSFLVTVGQIKSAALRQKIFNELIKYNAMLASVVSPEAYVSQHAQVGKGVIVMHGAVINAAAVVGDNSIVNTGAVIEHDSQVGDHCHISTNAVVNGTCRIGNGVFIGSNATILNNITIAAGNIVGAGALVNRNLDQAGVYTGNPARRYDSQ